MIQAINKPLTLRQNLFIQYYTSNEKTKGNATQSAVSAGYTWNFANQASIRLLGNIRIKQAVEANLAVIDSKDKDSRGFIDNEFSLCLSRSKAAGNEQAVIKCLENMGKNRGYFETDNAQKQPQTANIAIIESEAALDALELKLIQKQKALGNAICEG